MKGPVEFCTRWGLAFEPHLQNVSIAFRDGMPVRMVLRDLDGTTLDRVRIRPMVRVHRLRLTSGTCGTCRGSKSADSDWSTPCCAYTSGR
jgi:hypothetical protein